MTLSNGVLTMFAVFCLVMLRSIQQQNIIHRLYKWAVITSYGIAYAEITLILYVVKQGWAAGLWVGTGGALGVCAAMYIHKRFIQPRIRPPAKPEN